MTGWNGLHCTLEGCPGQCTGHGSCVAGGGGGFGLGDEREWSCECEGGWEGDDCSVRMESDCSDEVDNDAGTWFNLLPGSGVLRSLVI